MDEKQYQELVAKMQGQFDSMKSETQARINEAVEKATKGQMTAEAFNEFKEKELADLSKKASELQDAVAKQGNIINGLVESKPKDDTKSIEDLIEENMPRLKELKKAGTGFIEVPVGAAKVNTIANTVNPASPYAPGVGGTPLTIYDILRNPQFLLNYVNQGRTNQSRLAWINETSISGSPALVAEGGLKPLTSHAFNVELSTAKKIAAYIQLTDEFDVDLPGLSTQVKRMLQNDVLRFFDDFIQQEVVNNSTPVDLSTSPMSGFKNQVYDATYWDALMVMYTQVRINNFIPNVSLLNPVLWAKMQMGKDTVGRYNYPSDEFQNRVNPIAGNKIYGDNAFVGDLKQFNVDIYEDFVLKMGWINDDLIRNQFTIVGEIRFHDYISTARKKAIIYGNAKYVAEQINGGSNVIIGS